MKIKFILSANDFRIKNKRILQTKKFIKGKYTHEKNSLRSYNISINF